MSEDFDLALHAKADYLDFEVGSLKAQLAFANRRIDQLEQELADAQQAVDKARRDGYSDGFDDGYHEASY